MLNLFWKISCFCWKVSCWIEIKYRSDKKTGLVIYPGQIHFLVFKSRVQIYSLPQETRIYIKCKNFNHFEKYADETTISGIGEATFKPGCSITLPNSSKFKTPINRMTEKMENSKIFEILRIYPIPTVKIQKLTSNECHERFCEWAKIGSYVTDGYKAFVTS